MRKLFPFFFFDEAQVSLKIECWIDELLLESKLGSAKTFIYAPPRLQLSYDDD